MDRYIIMYVWKLVSGIISRVSLYIILLQFCREPYLTIARLSNNVYIFFSGVIWVALLLYAAGRITTYYKKKSSRWVDLILIILYGIAAFIGFKNVDFFCDLKLWSWWAAVCAGMTLVSICLPLNNEEMSAPKDED